MKFSLFFLLSIWSLSIFAQNTVPEAVNYQTVICDTLGNPLTNQDVSVRITILDSVITGSPVYQEIWSSQTTNQFGLINLAIGRGNAQQIPPGGPTPIFSDIAWNNGPKFIKVDVDPQNGFNWQDMGRAELLTVPYAMHTKSANSAETAEAAQIAQFAEFAQIADSAISAQTSDFALLADSALNAQTATTSLLADSAIKAQTSDLALLANSAINAQTATTTLLADSAIKAQTSDLALLANSALNAQTATTTLLADSAIKAQTSDHSLLADSALNAQVAETAKIIISDAGMVRAEGQTGIGHNVNMLTLSVDLTGKEGRWIHIYGGTAISETTNSSNTCIIRLILDNNAGVQDTISALRQGIGALSNGLIWDQNATASLAAQGYFQITNDYTLPNVTIKLNGGIDNSTGQFIWGDQGQYLNFDGEKAGAYLGFAIF